MTKHVAVVLTGSAATLLGIAISAPLVITAGALLACGTLLLAILAYFEAVP